MIKPQNFESSKKNRLIRSVCLLVILLFFFFHPGVSQTIPGHKVLKFINGKWFDGNAFISKTYFSESGILKLNATQPVDSVIDLKGGFVLPPFGEAHNHNVRKFSGFQGLSNQYLKAGIFYVKNPNCLNDTKGSLIESGLINQKNTIDASFANGGFTIKGGHPVGVVKIQMIRGEWTEKEEGDGNFYNAVNSGEDIDKKFSNVLTYNPDFIKIFLLFSEEFEEREHDEKYDGVKGLSVNLAEEVVKKSHAAGLRVSAHLETAADFHNALLANVDEMSHMPGFRGDPMLNHRTEAKDYNRFLIDKNDAMLAAKKRTTVVTTLSDVKRVLPFYMPMRHRIIKVGKKNLKTLHEAGVNIALGSDSFEKNSLAEVFYLKGTGIFTNLEILKMLCEATPKTIFPQRKIARLDEGYEASFVVLKDNPIKNIKAVKKINFWIKQGIVLNNQLLEEPK